MAIAFTPGSTVGPYLVEAMIGRGGMGVVVRARHRATGATHALKVILVSVGADPERLVARFRREVESLARIEPHAHLVRIHACGIDHGRPWCAMELVAGRSLAEWLRHGPLEPPVAAALVGKLARAVAHVHAHDVIHRDIKPENVIIDERREPRLVDFGLAYDAFSEQLTATGECVGTPAFMAPEQVSASSERALGPPVDVYGLGGLLYSALTAHAPFESDGGQAMAILARVVNELPPRPASWRPGLDADLEAICLRALAKRPEDRYPTASALAEDLERFLRGESVEAKPIEAGVLRSRGARVGIAAIVLVAIIGLLLSPAALRGRAPAASLAALERVLEERGPLDAEEEQELAAVVVALEDAGTVEQRRRAEVLRFLAAVVGSPAGSDAEAEAARGLATAVRPEGALDRTLLGRASRTLHGARRLGPLSHVLHGAEPIEPASVELAGPLALAIADGGSTEAEAALLAPPFDAVPWKALLRGVGLDEATRGRLFLRRAEHRLAVAPGDRDAIFADLESAIEEHGIAPDRGSLPWELQRWALERFLRLIGDEGSEIAAIRTLSDVVIRGGQPGRRMPADLAVAFQKQLGLSGYLHLSDALTPARAERILETAALLDAHGAWPYAPPRFRAVSNALGLERLVRIGDEDAGRPIARRNPARLLYLAAHVPTEHADRRVAWADAALAVGLDEVWVHLGAARQLRVDPARAADVDAEFARALELDRALPDAERTAYVTNNIVLRSGGRHTLDERFALALESVRISDAAVHGPIQEFVEVAGAVPWRMDEAVPVVDLLHELIVEALDLPESERSCCGRADEGGVDVSALVDAAVRSLRDAWTFGLVEIVEDPKDASLTGSIAEVGARHELRHERWESALDHTTRGIRGSRVKKQLARLHGLRAAALDGLGRADDAAAARAEAERLGQ